MPRERERFYPCGDQQNYTFSIKSKRSTRKISILYTSSVAFQERQRSNVERGRRGIGKGEDTIASKIDPQKASTWRCHLLYPISSSLCATLRTDPRKASKRSISPSYSRHIPQQNTWQICYSSFLRTYGAVPKSRVSYCGQQRRHHPNNTASRVAKSASWYIPNLC